MFDIRNSVFELTTAILDVSLMGDSPLNQIISGAGFPMAWNTRAKDTYKTMTIWDTTAIQYSIEGL